MKTVRRITAAFEKLKSDDRKALIGYVTAGFPDKAGFKRLIPILEDAGLDILEIGVPFSDPIADGVTIQQSSQVALSNGVTLHWVLKTVQELRRHVHLPIVLMSYSNPILAMGIQSFFRSARHAGVDGVIVPDLIPEEASLFHAAAKKENVNLIYLVSPTTPSARIAWIARQTEGFLYAVALAGVTGARQALSQQLPKFVASVRRVSSKPVAVGFGLSTPSQVAEVSQYADGVIVGSALIKAIEASGKKGFRGAAEFVISLRRALDRQTSAS